MIQALIECDSLGRAHIKELQRYQAGVRLKPPTVVIRDNILTATAYTDSLEVKITWLEKELEHYKVKSEQVSEIQTVEVNRLSWFQKLFFWIGLAATIIATTLVIYKISTNGKK